MSGRALAPRFVAAVALLGASSCVTSRFELSAVSTKNVKLTDLKIDPAMLHGRGVGRSCNYKVFVVSGGSPSLVQAIDRALEERQGNLLLDAVITYHWYDIPYIYGEECYDVEGEVANTYD